MKLIIGLGNPGDQYADSRHNIGFSVIKALSKNCKIPLKRESGTFSLSGRGHIAGQSVILALPLTFMNLSGGAVAALAKKHRIDLEDLLVICDDLDLELGRLKIKPNGSCAGHRGLKSIIDSLGSQDFSRLRIGIGRPPRPRIDASEYVLLPFARKEKNRVKEAIEKAGACVESWADRGISETMNIFNTRSKKEPNDEPRPS